MVIGFVRTHTTRWTFVNISATSSKVCKHQVARCWNRRVECVPPIRFVPGIPKKIRKREPTKTTAKHRIQSGGNRCMHSHRSTWRASTVASEWVIGYDTYCEFRETAGQRQAVIRTSQGPPYFFGIGLSKTACDGGPRKRDGAQAGRYAKRVFTATDESSLVCHRSNYP